MLYAYTESVIIIGRHDQVRLPVGCVNRARTMTGYRPASTSTVGRSAWPLGTYAIVLLLCCADDAAVNCQWWIADVSGPQQVGGRYRVVGQCRK